MITNLLLYPALFLPWLKRRYPNGRVGLFSINAAECEDAIYHVNFYLPFGLLVDLIAEWTTPWLLLIHVTTLGQIFYKELIQDGHLKFWNTETPEARLDCKVDLITRGLGWALPALIGVFILWI